MYNLLAIFKRHKYWIIPFNAYRQMKPEYPQEMPDIRCKILPFKANNNLAAVENRTGRCKLDFIWDHLP